MMDLLSSQMAEILEAMLLRGFRPPLYYAAISTNGSIIVAKYESAPNGTLDANIITSHSPEATFTLPINITFVDVQGEAARVVIDTSGEHKILH